MTRIAPRILLVLALVWAPAAPAAIINLAGVFSGAAENPPNASPGTGFVTVLVDTLAHLMTIHAEWSGLLSPTTVAHIHCCTPPTGNAGVATAVPSFPGFPAGVTAGTFDIVVNLTLASSFNPAFITANGGTVAGAEAALLTGLSAGLAYFNIHTVQFPGGEIRANLVVLPEPASLMLVGVALAALVAFRRR